MYTSVTVKESKRTDCGRSSVNRTSNVLIKLHTLYWITHWITVEEKKKQRVVKEFFHLCIKI